MSDSRGPFWARILPVLSPVIAVVSFIVVAARYWLMSYSDVVTAGPFLLLPVAGTLCGLVGMLLNRGREPQHRFVISRYGFTSGLVVSVATWLQDAFMSNLA